MTERPDLRQIAEDEAAHAPGRVEGAGAPAPAPADPTKIYDPVRSRRSDKSLWAIVDGDLVQVVGGGGGGIDGADGADGASAYEIAVADGFVGTEAQWLASLEGPAGPAGANAAVAPDWLPNTDYLANALLRAPTLELVRVIADYTSGAAYDSTKHTVVAGKGVLGYAEIRAEPAAIGAVGNIAGLILPTFTINAGDPAVWVEWKAPYWSGSAIGSTAVAMVMRTEDSTLWGTTFTNPAGAAGALLPGTTVKERFTTPGNYTLAARAQSSGGGTVALKAAARVVSYIKAEREV